MSVAAVLPPPQQDPPPDAGARAARSQIRGSSLLLGGRIFSVFAKMGAQVMVVRYLSTSDYGTWAYALAAVAFLGAFAHLSLDRAVGRFAAIYHQQKQYDLFLGVIALVLITVCVTGTIFVAAINVFPDLFGRLTGGDPRTLGLLLIMIFLVPLEALDTLLIALFATFSRPRAIFVRRYIVTPVVQVGLVLLLIGLGADLRFLAYGYVGGAVFGVLISLWLLVRIFREQDLMRHVRPSNIRVPARELLSFSMPLMTSDWINVLTLSSGALILGYLFTAEDVGLLRVVVPVALLNQIVMQSFHLLFVPLASRLFADRDIAAVEALYWRTSLWIAVLTFPLFAVMFGAARPLTVLMFGERYEAAGAVLAVLAIGQYVQAALGFNGTTIKVLGRVRLLVGINLAAAVVNIALAVILIPAFGVMGAAVTMTATLIIHNMLKQWGLRSAGGFRMLNEQYQAPVRAIITGCILLMPLPLLGIENGVVLATAAAAISLWVVIRTKRTLGVDEIFPELERHPLVRRVLT